MSRGEAVSVGTTAETTAVMPHAVHALEEFNKFFPSLCALPELPLHDFVVDSLDEVYQHGLRIAKDIHEEVGEQGRRRHPEAKMNIMNPIDQACVVSVFYFSKLNSSTDISPREATATWTVGRRRSATMNPGPATSIGSPRDESETQADSR